MTNGSAQSSQRAGRPLFREHHLPIVVAQCHDLLVVVAVDERLPRALLDFAGQIRHQIIAVEVDLIGHVADRVALQQLVLDVGIAGHGEEGRQPVVMRDHLVRHGARLDLAGPADHARHPIGALPVGVLLAPERRHRPIGPGKHVRTVIGAVHDKGVVGDAGIVERLQHVCRHSCRDRSSRRGIRSASGPPGLGSPASHACGNACA